MNANYIFLCGMVWSRFGEPDAGLELIRALGSADHHLRVLARAMLEEAADGSKALLGEALVQNEISPDLANLCGFQVAQGSMLTDRQAKMWFSPASA